MREAIFKVLLFTLVILLLSSNVIAISSHIEGALLISDWGKVIELLKQDDSKANDPIARLIMGHAYLAANKNNESMLLFISIKEKNDLMAWSEWTDSLLRKNSQNPAARYLSSDAKARQGSLKEAIDGFTQAIKIKNDFALAYNARGVVRVLNNEWDEALIDFIQATQRDPKLADAYANLGTYWVIKEAPEGAIEAFNQALAINLEFALAYNGRGSGYFGKGEFENAAMDFNMASSLAPLLVVADINNGFASAYASKLITLASAEKKLGTTLESVIKQYPDVLKEQKQQILKMLPSQNDREFWRKVDALPWILQSEEKTQALVKEYGLQKVQMGAFLKIQEYKKNIAETNQKVQTLYNKISSYDKKIWNIRVAEVITSLGFSGLGTAMDLQKGWDVAEVKAQLRAEKTALSSVVSNPTLKAFIDAYPVGFNPLDLKSAHPVGLAGSIASSGFKIGRSVLEDKRDAANVEFETLANQVPAWGAQLRAIETSLSRLGGTSPIQSPIKSSSQLPGYYTSIDRPLNEIGALASMVDKSVKNPMDGSRRALVVAQDPFRANLQQQELHKYGFETRVISPGVDVQTEAKRWGADVIIGIKGTPEMKAPQMGYSSIDDPSKKIYYEKKIPPPFPPDKFGGAGVGKWEWGKQFIPTYPKGAPGGISTEEIARAFVDKGNWPVLTSFGLFYEAGELTKE